MMKHNSTNLIDWLRDHPLISVGKLEKEAGVPAGSLHKAVNYGRSFNEAHLSALAVILKKYGYKKA